MTADIYYAVEIQSEYGNITRTWQFDRTVNCSAISAISGVLDGELKVKDKSFDYASSLFFRTNVLSIYVCYDTFIFYIKY